MSYLYPDHIRADILRMIPEDGKVIGSIGCGPAATEYELVKAGRQVHGVDVAAQAIALAEKRLTSARLVQPDELVLFEPASLDGLILADVIEHIPHAWAALKRFADAVKPGGWVVISVPNMRNLNVLKQFFWHGDWPEDPYGIFDQTHFQVMSKKRLERWCREACLEPEQWFDLYDPRRWRRHPLMNKLTFGVFHSWFMFQLQVRCRKGARAAA